MNEIKEPIVAAPNNPDNIKLLSEVVNDPIQEVFVSSCMTNIGHYRATAKVLQGAGTAPEEQVRSTSSLLKMWGVSKKEVWNVSYAQMARENFLC